MFQPSYWSQHPLEFAADNWPKVTFYKQQREIIESFRDNGKTIVPAGNRLGKDFVAAFIVLWAFLTHPVVRIVTTSVRDDHLRVLWDEIARFIKDSKRPLDHQLGGPLVCYHRFIRKRIEGTECRLSYVRGMVSETEQGFQGHHAPYTAFIVDEASGVADQVFEAADTWADRMLIFGNCNQTTNQFYRAVEEGDVPADDGTYHQRVIRIRGEDSPNVRLGLAQQLAGETPTNEVLVPGVVTWKKYQQWRKTLDPVRQCIVLDAVFYKGAQNLLYPPSWLNRAEQIAAAKCGGPHRLCRKTLGVDPAEGGDRTAWAVSCEHGLLELLAVRTTDTSTIAGHTLATAMKWGVADEDILFDAGGGGKQHADYLRQNGHDVQTVRFGEAATEPLDLWPTDEEKEELRETRYVYKNRRAEMYGLLRNQLDPDLNEDGWGIPPGTGPDCPYTRLRKQLSILPLQYDGEGRMWLPPKDRKDPNSKVKTLREMLGGSPDESDSVVLSVYGLKGERVASAGNVMF